MAELVYVNPASDDDTGDGTTPNAGSGGTYAFKTLEAAITAIDDGGTIKLVDGTYNVTTQSWDNLLMVDKSYTIEPYLVSSITFTRDSGTSFNWFNAASAYNDRIWTFNNINFVMSKNTSRIFFFETGDGGTFICNNCYFTPATDSYVLYAITDASITDARRAIFNSCTLTSAAYTVSVWWCRAMKLLEFNDCTLESTSSDADQLIYHSYSQGHTILRRNRITGFNVFKYFHVHSSGRMAKLIMQDNNFYSNAEWDGYCLYLGGCWWSQEISIEGALIQNNLIYGFRYGIYTDSESSLYDNNVVYCRDPFILYGAHKNLLRNNTLKAHDTEDQARCLLFNRLDRSPELDPGANTSTFTSTTVTAGSAYADWDLDNVPIDGTCKVLCKATSGAKPSVYWGIITSADTVTKEVTVLEWRKVSDGSVETPADNTYYVSCTMFAEQNTIVNNVFDSSEATYNHTFDFNPLDGENYIDYNNYYQGNGTYLTNLGSEAIENLEAQQSKWLAWPEDTYSDYISICKYNDANSTDENPLLDGNYLPHNLAVLKSGKPDINGTSSSIGAVIPKNKYSSAIKSKR